MRPCHFKSQASPPEDHFCLFLELKVPLPGPLKCSSKVLVQSQDLRLSSPSSLLFQGSDCPQPCCYRSMAFGRPYFSQLPADLHQSHCYSSSHHALVPFLPSRAPGCLGLCPSLLELCFHLSGLGAMTPENISMFESPAMPQSMHLI